MKKTHVSSFVSVIFGMLLLATSAIGQTYSQLEALVEAKNYSAANALAEQISDKESGEPRFDLFYGIAARETDHPEISIFAFERVLMKNPKDARAQYEMALSLIKVSDFRGAKVALSAAIAHASSATLKGNASRLLPIVTKGLERNDKPLVVFQGITSVGYNNNINSSSIELIPGSPIGPAIADGFTNILLSGFIQKQITKKDSVYFSLATMYRKNFSSTKFDFNTIFAGAGFQTMLGSFHLKFPYTFEFVVVAYNPIIINNAVGVDISTNVADHHNVSVGAHFKAKHYNLVDDRHVVAELTAIYKGRFKDDGLKIDGRLFYNPILAYAYKDIIGQAVKSEWGVIGRLRYEFIRSHFFFVEAKYQVSNYWNTTILGFARDDRNLSTQVGYDWKLSKHWSAGPSYQFVYNTSNVDINNYMRHQVQLGLKANF